MDQRPRKLSPGALDTPSPDEISIGAPQELPYLLVKLVELPLLPCSFVSISIVQRLLSFFVDGFAEYL